MEKKQNKFIAVAYDLFASDDTGRHLVERVPADKPFAFISGFGITIKAFEEQLEQLETGASFDFSLTPDQAYGEFDDQRIVELEKEMFCIDGKFDHEHVRIDAIVPLQNQEGDRFMARVLDIRDDVVVMDFNHPLAGRDLQFVGSVVESRDATEAEVDRLIRQLTGADGCGQCGGCVGGDCGEGDCAEGDAGCPGGKGGCCHKG